MLQLLALIDDSDAQPGDATSRLARKNPRLGQAERTSRRCVSVGCETRRVGIGAILVAADTWLVTGVAKP
jgi:hypothetical protein